MSESKRNPIDITEIHCPDCCTVPAAEKGCHFQAGADAFTCAKCQLRIRRSYSGYLLTCEDLNEMLHGLKITSEAKALLRGGKEHKARQIQSGGTGGDAGGLPQLWRQDISDHEGRWIQALRLRRISQMHLRKQIRSAHFQSGCGGPAGQPAFTS